MRDASPYKGLEPYGSEDRGLFFGREDDRKILIAKLFSARVTLFFGVTGAGKSSLLGAGIIPELTDQHLDVTYHFKWNPREDPRISLKTSIKDTLFALGRISSPDSPDWRSLTLKTFLERYSIFASDPFVIIIDQFEEFFLYHTHSPFFDDFIQELSDAIHDRNLSLAFILAMREDFLAELDVFWDKVPSLSDNRYRLKKLTLEQARESIVRPAQEVGFTYEPELVTQLLHDLSGQYSVGSDQYSVGSDQYSVSSDQYSVSSDQYPASSIQHPASSVEAPYLQIVCNELWQAEQNNPQKMLTLEQYKKLGGTQNIVRQHFEQVMEKFSLREQVLAFELFQHLVTARGTKMAYRDEDLADALGVPVEQVRPILEYLAIREVRILRLDNRPDGFWYELYHDVFAEIIRHWTEQFQEDENRRIYGQIVAASRKWSRAGKDEAALLRGGRLSQADEWTQSHRENLSPDEKEFVEASSKKRRQTRLLRRAIVGMIALLAVVAVFFGVSAEREKNEAERLRIVSIAQSLAAQALHQQELEQDERAALLARQAFLFNQRNRGHMLSQIDNALRNVLYVSYSNHVLNLDREVTSVTLSSDGQTLASGSSDGTIRLWNLRDLPAAPVILRGHKLTVWSVAFSPDKNFLASGSEDKTIRLWDLQNLEALPVILRGHESIVFSIAFSPDGKKLASGSLDSTMRLWDVKNPGADPLILRGHQGGINSVAFSPNGQTLASSSSDETVRLWDLQKPDADPLVLRGHEGGVESVDFSPDGKSLASGSSDESVWLWDLQDLSASPIVLCGHTEGILSIVFSPDGTTLASGSWDKTVRLWDLQNPDIDPVVLRAHDDLIFSITFSPDGQTLASVSKDNTVRLWDLSKPDSFTTVLIGDTRGVKSMVFNQDSQVLFSVHDNGIVQKWNLDKPNAAPTNLLEHKRDVTATAFSPDGQTLALGSNDGTMQLWDMDDPDATPFTLPDRHTGRVRSVAFSPDGKNLASGSEDKTVRIWEVENSDADPTILKGHQGPVFSVAFSPDGQTLVSGSGSSSSVSESERDNRIRLWDLRNPNDSPKVSNRQKEPILSVAFSPDGKTLASGSEDKTVRLWEVENLKADSLILHGHTDRILSVLFSPNGKTLASVSEDKTVRLWDLQNPKADPITLQGHEDRIESVTFSPDGRHLAWGGQNGTIVIWKITTNLADEVCQKVWRNLTTEEWRQFVGTDIPYESTCPEMK